MVIPGPADDPEAAGPPDEQDGDPLRIVEAGLAHGRTGDVPERAAARLVSQGRIGELLDVLDTGAADDPAVRALSAVACRDEVVHDLLLHASTPDFELLDRLLERWDPPPFDALLSTMAESESRAVRRGAFDRLVQLGPGAVDAVRPFLGDLRWFVIRNMVALLRELAAVPEGISPTDFLRHPDPRVRLEALRLCLVMGVSLTEAVTPVVFDPDHRVTHFVVHLLRDDCPPALLSALIRRAGDASLPGETRALAVEGIGRVRDPRARDCLVGLVDTGRRTLRGRIKLDRRSPLVVRAVGSLAAHWADDPRVAPLLAAARASGDPGLRGAAGEA